MNLELLHDLIKNNERLLNYSKYVNLIKKSLRCKKCTREMKEEKYERYIFKNCWKCSNCKSRKSLLVKSFFQNTKIEPKILLRLFWAEKDDLIFLSKELNLSGDTINWYYKFCREAILEFYALNFATIIGGPNHVVHIDETLICKRKIEKQEN